MLVVVCLIFCDVEWVIVDLVVCNCGILGGLFC